jgi:hypothetical protein
MDNPNPSFTVKEFLQTHGYHIKDIQAYREGIAHKQITTGNPDKGIPYRTKLQPKKIGAILEQHNAPERVRHAYTHDEVRIGAGQKDYDLVISNHPHDVYGMSTGRSWTSCTDMTTKGVGTNHMPAEINHNTHVAYLVNPGASHDTNAIARIDFKEHTALTEPNNNGNAKHQTLIAENRVYGTAPTDFRATAIKEMSKMFPIKHDIYMKNGDVYNDSGAVFHMPEDNIKPEMLDAAWKMTEAKNKARLYSYVGLEGKYKSKKLREVQNSLKELMKPHSGDFVEDMSRIKAVHYGLDKDQQVHGLEYNKAVKTTDIENHIAQMMHNFNPHDSTHSIELRATSYHHPLRHVIYSALQKTIPAVSDVESFKTAHEMHKILGNRGTEKLDVAPNHTLGSNPMMTLGKAGALKDVDDFRKAYYTFSKTTNDNLYATAYHMNEEGIPNADKFLTHAEHEFTRTNTGDGSLTAISFHYLSPAARHHFSKISGIDGDALLEKHKDFIDKLQKPEV